MKCVILMVIAISASGAMFDSAISNVQAFTVNHFQHDNMLREVEDREEKTFNFVIVPGMNSIIHS